MASCLLSKGTRADPHPFHSTELPTRPPVCPGRTVLGVPWGGDLKCLRPVGKEEKQEHAPKRPTHRKPRGGHHLANGGHRDPASD